MHNQSGLDNHPPWDPQSDFTATNAALYFLESILDQQGLPVLETLYYSPSKAAAASAGQVAQLVFSHAYHQKNRYSNG